MKPFHSILALFSHHLLASTDSSHVCLRHMVPGTKWKKCMKFQKVIKKVIGVKLLTFSTVKEFWTSFFSITLYEITSETEYAPLLMLPIQMEPSYCPVMSLTSCRGCGFGRVSLWSALRTVKIMLLSLTTGKYFFVYVLVTVELLVTPAIYHTNVWCGDLFIYLRVRLTLIPKSNL